MTGEQKTLFEEERPQEKHVTKVLCVDKLLGEFYAIAGDDGKPFVPKINEAGSIKFLPSDVVVDVGAYIGTFSLLATLAGVASVTAYEPTPSTFEVLESNAKNFTARRMAIVADAAIKEVEFFLSRGIGVRNSILPVKGRERVVVPAISYVEATRDASVVKVDVEGAEYEYPLLQKKLRWLMIDFHPRKEFDWVSRARSIVEEFVGAGFRVVDEPKFKKGWNASWDACATLERLVR